MRHSLKQEDSSIGGSRFLLNIRYQQQSSWQGQIQRLDSGETINFRSALELLTLIESAIQDQEKYHEERQRFRKWNQEREVDTCSNCTNTAGE